MKLPKELLELSHSFLQFNRTPQSSSYPLPALRRSTTPALPLPIYKHARIDLGQMRFICHGVVHGGDFMEPVKIDEELYSHIEHFSHLAPLYICLFFPA